MKVRYKAHVIIEWDHDPETGSIKDPETDLEGLMSGMDEVGRRDLDSTVVSIKPLGATE